jgi:hypothetical protein
MSSVENNPLNFPSLAQGKSLAQAVRSKDLKQARNILLVIGILTVLANGFFTFRAKAEVDKEIDKQIAQARAKGLQVHQDKVQLVRESALRITYLVQGGGVILGVIFIVLGFMVKSYPVPATILGLVLYLAGSAIFAYIDPMSLMQGIIFKVIVVVSLFSGVKSALGYQRSLATNPTAA